MIGNRFKSLILMFFISCSADSNENNEKDLTVLDSMNIKSIDSTVVAGVIPDKLGLEINSIQTLKPVLNEDSECLKWKKPKKEDIVKIASFLKEVDSQEWNMCYGDWSCGVEGYLIISDEKFYFILDGGGWIILNDSTGNQRYYVCPAKSDCWSYFPSECFCDVNGNIIDT